MAKVWKAPSAVFNHLPRRIHQSERTELYSLYHRNGNNWTRTRMVAYPFGYALKLWATELVTSSSDYKLREVDTEHKIVNFDR